MTVSKNEILAGLNKPDDFILALVQVSVEPDEDTDGVRATATAVHYMRQPFRREPDFGVTSVNYVIAELLARAEASA